MAKEETWEEMEARHVSERREMMLRMMVKDAQGRKAAFADFGLSGIANYAAVCFHLNVDDLIGPSRTANFVAARHLAFHTADEAGFSLSEIGRFFGGRDHTTIKSGIARHRARAAIAQEGAARVAQILRDKALMERARA